MNTFSKTGYNSDIFGLLDSF